MTKIKWGKQTITIEAGKWSSTAPELARYLEAVVTLDTMRYYPDRDLALAQEAITVLGSGKIEAATTPVAASGRVY